MSTDLTRIGERVLSGYSPSCLHYTTGANELRTFNLNDYPKSWMYGKSACPVL